MWWFNGSIIKFSKKLSEKIINDGGQVSYIFVGKKAYQSLQRFMVNLFWNTFPILLIRL